MSGPPTTPIDCRQDPVAAARYLAACFDAGRRLVVRAPLHPDHAHHVAVEFMHPVIAGTAALPALVARPSGGPGGGDDVVLLIGELGDTASGAPVDLHIPIGDDSQIMVAYHLLWELVQLELSAAAEPGGDSTDFLYPFLDGEVGDAEEHLLSSAAAKTAESHAVSRTALHNNGDVLAASTRAIVDATAGGGRILTMGNGGSACDAARAVRLLDDIGLPAQSLAADYAVTTALANDLGALRIFARQIEALGRPGDVVIGFSTSGTSGNILAAFDQAAQAGMTTIGFAGYDGTGFVEHPSIVHTLAVASQSVHRIQEAQAVLLDALVAAIGELRHSRGQEPAGAVS